MNKPTASPDLASLRVQIDSLDQQLLSLLNQRACVAEQVGELKNVRARPFPPRPRGPGDRKNHPRQPRPAEKRPCLGHLARNHVGLPGAGIPQRVAVLGPEGTFCEAAAIEYFGGAADLMYCNSFDEVFHATAAGSAQYGVVGVENSNEGVVTRSLDMFLHTPCHIVGEVSLLVRHNLLRPSPTADGIEAVLAHPQALAQCHAWLSKHLPHAERRPVSSNAEGARLAATHPQWAAISSERAAQQYGLYVVARAIQDDAYNRTRFAIICLPHTLATPAPSAKDCTSLIISVPNRPGAVHDLLVPLKKHGVSMTRFESRPARTGQWEYYFYIDIEGHPAQANVAAALAELQQLCAFYKVLGTYPVAA